MSDGFKSRVVKGPQLALPIVNRKAKLPERVVREHQVRIDTKPGRAPAPARSRWTCDTCNVGGDWTTTDKAHAGADAHVKAGSK